jgi:hypothetical protein
MELGVIPVRSSNNLLVLDLAGVAAITNRIKLTKVHLQVVGVVLTQLTTNNKNQTVEILAGVFLKILLQLVIFLKLMDGVQVLHRTMLEPLTIKTIVKEELIVEEEADLLGEEVVVEVDTMEEVETLITIDRTITISATVVIVM